MQFNTWGIGRRDEIVSTFEPDRFPFIERVKSHLDLELIEIKGNGEPVQIALGERANPGDPEAAQPRVTPFFSSFDALDFFCRLNLQNYLAFDPADGLPRRWFWEESQRRRQTAVATPVTAPVSGVVPVATVSPLDVPAVPTAGQDDPSAEHKR